MGNSRYTRDSTSFITIEIPDFKDYAYNCILTLLTHKVSFTTQYQMHVKMMILVMEEDVCMTQMMATSVTVQELLSMVIIV